jgi:hypothetical protein
MFQRANVVYCWEILLRVILFNRWLGLSVKVNICFLSVGFAPLTARTKFSIVLQVELLIPQLQVLDDEGAQLELWELSKVFLDTLIEETKCQVSGMYSGSS